MRKSPIFFLILMLTTSGILLVAADYGESSASLGQFTDEYTDLDYTSVRVDVVRNATYNAIELNYTAILGFYEDFEDNNLDNWDVTIGATTGTDYKKTGLYGARVSGSAGILEKNFPDITPSAVSAWLQPKIYRTYFNWKDSTGGETTMGIYHREDTNTWYISGSNQVFATSCAENNWYNLWFDDIDFVAFTYDVYVYDSGMVLKGSVNDAPFQTNYNHFDYIKIQAGTASSGQCYFDDFNVSFGEGGYSAEGYFTTTDYLDEANGSSLVQLTNTTIPEGTGITVEFSEDDSSWVLNDWAPIGGGFESIDLRDLNYSGGCFIRYNFSTTNREITPRLYQSRLITTEGETGSPGIGDVTIIESDFPWIAIAIILSLISYLLLSTRK